jgi:hypothetical protein
MPLAAKLSIFLVLVILAGCGTPGAPQAPSLNLAAPVTDLKAARTGNQVKLTWTVPVETTDGAKFRHRGETKVCRATNQGHMEKCSPVLTLPSSADQKTASADVDLASGNAAPTDYETFAVEVDNDRGRNAGLSNQVQVPAAIVSTLNGSPRIQLLPDAVLATANVSLRGTSILQVIELRRQEKGAAQISTVAQRAIDIASFGESANIELRDETFTWEKTYEYSVALAASTKVPNGDTVTFDAAVSSPQELVAHDVFPPGVPSGVQAVYSSASSGEASIDLTWNPDLDRDLAGYFVYRREQGVASEASKMNEKPVTAPAFHDAGIRPGITYLYSVSAIDERGNESKRSEETQEEVPQ